MEREIKGELFNALCKRCGERRTCHGICVDMNAVLSGYTGKHIIIRKGQMNYGIQKDKTTKRI